MPDTLRIANCSGFYGDRLAAAREMVDGGEIDVLTGDYLAELTMYILWKARSAGRPGYASTFLTQMEDVLGTCLDRGIKIVTNAGGLDPAGLAEQLRALGERIGRTPAVAHVTGDDLLPRLAELRDRGVDLRNLDDGRPLDADAPTPVTANAYLGARAIARALAEGADVVVCPRVTDASLVVGPCLWRFGWGLGDHDRLAGAVAAGHVIECGPQATGGNFAFVEEIAQPLRPGFPIAEMSADGSSVITKHPGTGGAVTVDTVTAQLVYEVGAADYLNTDVTLELDSIRLSQEAPDRVRMSGVRGHAPPPTVKVAVTCAGPYTQSVTFAVPGERVEQKAALVEAGMLDALGGAEQFDSVQFRLVRHDQPGAELNELAVATVEAVFAARDKALLGRRIFDAATGLALSGYPGIYFPGERQQRPSHAGINWPCLVPRSAVTERVVLHDGREIALPLDEDVADVAPPSRPREPASPITGPYTTVSLGTLFGARSGDKGAHANVGLWARSDEAWAWLRDALTVPAFRAVLPEADGLEIERTELPNLRAVNFLVRGLLGDGAASGARFDPQAKGLAEFVRSRPVTVPERLVAGTPLVGRVAS